MTRILRDSIDPSVLLQFPADLIGGYVDGIYGPQHAQFGQPGWDASSWDQFALPHVRIAVFSGTVDGNVGDDEQFDQTNAGLLGWVQIRRGNGIDPTGYTSFNNWAAARDTFIAAGVNEPWWWIANYSVVPQLFQFDNLGRDVGGRCVAHQYANGAMTGHNYDESLVADYWPGVDMAVDLDLNAPGVMEVMRRLEGISWAFAEAANPPPNQGEALSILRGLNDTVGRVMRPELDAVKVELDAIKAELDALPGVADPQVLAIVQRIEAALKSA